MVRSVESDLLRLALAAGFIAACNSESLSTPTQRMEPSRTPFRMATDTQTPESTKTFTPTATLIRTMTETLTSTRAPTPTLIAYEPRGNIKTPMPWFEIDNSSVCVRKPTISNEAVDLLYHTEIGYGNPWRQEIMLTFDDVGTEGDAEVILNALAKYNGKATFFITSSMFSYAPQAVRRIVADGHVLAVHSDSHRDFTKMKRSEIDDDLCRFFEKASKVVPGYNWKYFRFPYGARNPESRFQIATWNLVNVMWSYAASGTDKETVYKEILEHGGPGKIILLHLERKSDVEAVPLIVKAYSEAGYTIESLATGLR